MQDRREQESAFGSSRRRSRSEVPNADASGAERKLTPPDETEEGEADESMNADPQAPAGAAEGPAGIGETEGVDPGAPPPPLALGKPRGRRLVKKQKQHAPLSPEQRLLLLDTWLRSGLPAKDFAAMVGISKHSLYSWKRLFREFGPEGLLNQPRGRKKGSRMPELTKRAVLMMKAEHPDWGCQRISDMLERGPALPASPSAIARVLKEAGYESEETPVVRNTPRIRRFERDSPNQMWQTDLFSFMLKRQNRRVYVVAFLDDHSRFVVGFGIYSSQSSALVMEVLRSCLDNYGPPAEILTDNGSQYVTWRGKSAFSKELQKRGIKQIVARPRHPQTLGKIERFWGTLWRECADAAVFTDLEDARVRLRHFIDWYNFQRPHQGINGAVPADRFFAASAEVLATLKARVSQQSLELARHGAPRESFYVTGRAGEQNFSVHSEGQRLILKRDGEPRQEIALAGASAEDSGQEMPEPLCPEGSPAGPKREEDLPDRASAAPGTSPLDEGLLQMAREFGAAAQEQKDETPTAGGASQDESPESVGLPGDEASQGGDA